MTSRLDISRDQILAFRRKVGALDERLPPGATSLRMAAWAGLQDSMPRAALLSIHARVEGTEPSTWEDPSLVQLWGPRFSAYVVPKQDLAAFSLGRLDASGRSRRQADDMAARMATFLAGRRMRDRDVGGGLGIGNGIRYAAPTGTILIRWDGARAPEIWAVPAPDVDPHRARLELARRFLHVFGPTTPDGFAKWAGIGDRSGRSAFAVLDVEMTPVRTPIGDGWILTSDEPAFRSKPGPPAPARLLPSGDAYYLLWGSDRELLVSEPTVGTSCGRRVSGRAPCSSMARSSERGGERTRSYRSKCGGDSRRQSARTSRRRRRPCRYPASRVGSWSDGTIRGSAHGRA